MATSRACVRLAAPLLAIAGVVAGCSSGGDSASAVDKNICANVAAAADDRTRGDTNGAINKLKVVGALATQAHDPELKSLAAEIGLDISVNQAGGVVATSSETGDKVWPRISTRCHELGL